MSLVAPGAAVTVTAARVRYGRQVALDGVDLFAQGGVLALLGPNGAGKSTLLRCLATAQHLDDGAIRVDGLDPLAPAQRTEIRRRLGYLPQAPRFSPRARVFDVVDYLAICKGLRRARPRHAEVRRALDLLDLADVASRRVETLSGGVNQRLGLAQALIGAPSLVVLDEPATGLDPEQRLRLRGVLSHVGASATVVLSTHHIDEAAASAQRIAVLDSGVVRFVGTTAQLAAEARGRVWRASEAPTGAGVRLSWRLPDGSWRALGDPPPGAEPVEATVEDAYLLLVGAGARQPPPV